MSESIRGDRPSQVALSADAVAAIAELPNALALLPSDDVTAEVKRLVDILIDEVQELAAGGVE